MKPQKLTWEKVDRIRELYTPGEVGYKTLARMFDVHASTIKSIIREETWSPSNDLRNMQCHRVL